MIELVREILGFVQAIIIGAGVPIALVLLDRTRRHAKAARVDAATTKEQVTNDHDINLRDDLDKKFAQVFKVQAQHTRQIRGLRAADSRLEKEIEQTRDRPVAKPRSYKPKEN